MLEELRDDPHRGKMLQGNLTGIWSWRLSKYRILYKINNEEIEIFVINIGSRKKIY